MLKYWLWLTSLPGMTPAKVSHLMQCYATPEDVFFADDLSNLEFLTASDLESLSSKSFDMAEYILEQCDIKGLGIVTLQDAQYPPQLREIDDPPGVLYIKGSLNIMSVEPGIGIVGTRDATPYGLDISAMFAYNLAKGGMTVVSGMAKGIDARAHQGALRANRPNVAVLGCGVDIAYPAENEQLYHDIINMGAVISEFPPGTRPLGSNFPRRNRIISGLSLGVLIVEAPVRSGALITAHVAREQGRDVYAIPGSVGAPNSMGCNMLIRDFATLASSPNDILNDYSKQFPVELTAPVKNPQMPKPEPPKKQLPPPEVKKPKPVDVHLTPEQAKIVNALRGGPLSSDDIAASAGLDMRETLSELTMLEIAGVVRGNEAGIFEL